MNVRQNLRGGIWLLPLCLLVFLMLSCGSKEQLVGTYVANATDTARQSETTLELKVNGEGIWRVGDDEVNFSWYVKRDELRLNTKNGGVIVGDYQNDIIRITLPGIKSLSFKKVK
ncbi:MAG: hypothetical protein AB9866_22950 [Syntrophobacteraceae bacterium]